MHCVLSIGLHISSLHLLPNHCSHAWGHGIGMLSLFYTCMISTPAVRSPFFPMSLSYLKLYLLKAPQAALGLSPWHSRFQMTLEHWISWSHLSFTGSSWFASQWVVFPLRVSPPSSFLFAGGNTQWDHLPRLYLTLKTTITPKYLSPEHCHIFHCLTDTYKSNIRLKFRTHYLSQSPPPTPEKKIRRKEKKLDISPIICFSYIPFTQSGKA